MIANARYWRWARCSRGLRAALPRPASARRGDGPGRDARAARRRGVRAAGCCRSGPSRRSTSRGYGDIRTTDGSLPPALQHVKLEFDRDGRLTTAGLRRLPAAPDRSGDRRSRRGGAAAARSSAPATSARGRRLRASAGSSALPADPLQRPAPGRQPDRRRPRAGARPGLRDLRRRHPDRTPPRHLRLPRRASTSRRSPAAPARSPTSTPRSAAATAPAAPSAATSPPAARTTSCRPRATSPSPTATSSTAASSRPAAPCPEPAEPGRRRSYTCRPRAVSSVGRAGDS